MSAQVSFFFFDVYYAASSSSLFKATGLCALGCVVMVIFFQIRIRAKITWSQHVHIYILPELRCLYLLPACAHLYVRIRVQASASLGQLPFNVCLPHRAQEASPAHRSPASFQTSFLQFKISKLEIPRLEQNTRNINHVG
jgi:hypothetical protein